MHLSRKAGLDWCYCLQGPGEHLMNLFSFLLPHTRVPGAPQNSEALVRILLSVSIHH